MNQGNGLETIELNGERYVALTEGLQQIGGNAQWNNESKQATITSGAHTAQVTMADNNVTVDGRTVTLSAPPLVKNDTLYVPVDFFANVFGQQVFLA